MTAHPPTSTPQRPILEEEAFFAFLRARRAAPPATNPHALDGYLTALIIGPSFIDPRQWISSFVGENALTALEHTTGAKAVQSLVAAYNAISSGLGDTPETWRPRLAPGNELDSAPFLWAGGFLIATRFAPKLWNPILQGGEGDLIAPIREITNPRAKLDTEAIAAIAKAVVAIRAHFMPKREKSFR